MGKKKFNYGQVTTEPTYEALAVAVNVLQLTEVGDYEGQTLKLKQMYNRSRNAHITTEPPILVRCCYVPFDFINFNKNGNKNRLQN